MRDRNAFTEIGCHKIESCTKMIKKSAGSFNRGGRLLTDLLRNRECDSGYEESKHLDKDEFMGEKFLLHAG